MAYNPYAALSIDKIRLQSEFDKTQQRYKSEQETGKQKKKLAKEFSEDLEAVIKAAEAEQAARAIEATGLDSSYFKILPKNKEDYKKGQHYIKKDGTLHLYDGKNVLTWSPKTKKFA